MNAHERRWKIALAAVMIHLSIGSIYGWSQVAVTLKEQLNSLWSIQEITYTFSLAIMCLGLSAATFGHFVATAAL